MPLQKKTKDIEHTLNKPLVVAIEQLSPGEWTIQPQADFRNEANDRFKVKDEKGNTLRQNVDGEWTTRRAASAPPKPHSDPNGPKHTPILMREGEVLMFACSPAYPFEIWADRDPSVDVYPEAPNNPFGWTSPQSAARQGTITAKVLASPLDANNVATQPGPTEQRFYKFTAWVHTDTDLIVVDPDGSCDR